MNQGVEPIGLTGEPMASQFVPDRVDDGRELVGPRQFRSVFERPHCYIGSCTRKFAKGEAGAMEFQFDPARSSSSKSILTPGDGATSIVGCWA